jgi:hypothetical protein
MTTEPIKDVLIVSCKSCHKHFRSPTQMDAKSLESVVLGNNSYKCPHCHQMNVYDKADHIWGRPSQG